MAAECARSGKNWLEACSEQLPELWHWRIRMEPCPVGSWGVGVGEDKDILSLTWPISASYQDVSSLQKVSQAREE